MGLDIIKDVVSDNVIIRSCGVGEWVLISERQPLMNGFYDLVHKLNTGLIALVGSSDVFDKCIVGRYTPLEHTPYNCDEVKKKYKDQNTIFNIWESKTDFCVVIRIGDPKDRDLLELNKTFPLKLRTTL